MQKKSGNYLEIRKKAVPLQPQSREMLLIKDLQAEIAQLVEHNLAKVGVAGPSPVFRSHSDKGQVKQIVSYAQVAELVDAYVSGAYVARRAGSSPVLGTS